MLSEEEKVWYLLNELGTQKAILENTLAQKDLSGYDKDLLEQYQEELDLYKRTIAFIEKLQKENEELKNGKVYQDFKYYKELAGQYQGSCVPKDKIRELFKKYNINISEEEITVDGLDALTFISEIDELLEED